VRTLHDITESGSERKLSQLFRNAKAMQDGYASAGINAAQNLISPPVAKVPSILGENTGSSFCWSWRHAGS
jgi:hypothetical protein